MKMKILVGTQALVILMVISLTSVSNQQAPPPSPQGACFANFTKICNNTETATGLAKCCVFWSDLMKNEKDHPCMCSLFGIASFKYNDALGFLLNCQVNTTGFSFCPVLKGSPQLPPPPPPTKHVTAKPPSTTPPSNKTSTSFEVGIAVGAVLFVLVFLVLFFMWRKLMQQHKLLAKDQRNDRRKDTFTYEELVQATDGFSDKNYLGRGGFAFVHKGLLRDGREVAVKQLLTGGEEGEREFRIEIEIICRLHHKHIVSLIGHCITQERRLLVYEFVPQGSLHFRLHGEGQPVMDWSSRMKIAIGSARGIAYLHHDCNPRVIHRDIKSANILLDENFEAKIADFGLAKLKPEDKTHLSTRVAGTPGYLAPEYEATGHVTDKSDIYSFGVVIMELITGQVPSARYGPSMNAKLVDWVRPYLIRSIQDQDYDAIADPRLNGVYNHNEMARMVACAVSCVRHDAKLRPAMSLVIQILEGVLNVNVWNQDLEHEGSISYSLSESRDSSQQRSRGTRYSGGTHRSETSTSPDHSGTTIEGRHFVGSSLQVHAEEDE